MNIRYRRVFKPLFLIIIVLTLIFFIKVGSVLFKSIDKSKIVTEFVTENIVSIFNPEFEYLYWGEEHSFLKGVIKLFSPAYTLIYEEAALNAATVPSEYLTYYEAMEQSEQTGVATEVLSDQTENHIIENNTAGNAIAGNLYSLSQLSDYSFLVNEFYTVDRTTYIDEELLNVDSLLGQDMRVDKESGATILIYHTHSQEAFSDSNESDPSTSIVAVGEYLAQILSQTYGFNVIHNTEVYDLVDGKLDRNKAYTYAEESVAKILKENPQIEVIIDLHRDGVDGEKMTTNIGGKETAKLMFFNGLSRTVENGEIEHLYNPNLSGNLAMSFQAQLVANYKYPGLMRHIYLKGYQYNLHFLPRCMLIEAGSQKNTFQEMLNAMEPLADILNDVLTKEIQI